MALRIETAEYAEDMALVKDSIDLLANTYLFAVEAMWERWSEERYYAEHLCVTPEYIKEFEAWLSERIETKE
jgi:hypothetical protein